MSRMFIAATLVLLALSNATAQQSSDEREAMMKADRDFDLATHKYRVDGWTAFFAPNGSMVSDTLPPVLGPEAVRKVMSRPFSDTTFTLRWRPTRAEILIPGNIGYTVGRYERFKADSVGTIRKEIGTYATVWKKQPDGSWKVLLDTGEADK
jgi:ketosteroid isomerase-like protein